jgi:iron complex transport system permease protein
MAGVWLLCLAGWPGAGARARRPGAGRGHRAQPGPAAGPLRAALVAVLALATGTAVAQTGLIAFVGLAAPHLVRSVVKTTHAWLVLLASLMGGVLLMRPTCWRAG